MRAAALLLTSLYAVPAFAGPPFVTDDPEPVDYLHWEINYGSGFTRSADRTFGSLPGFDINYGLYPGVQLHAQPQIACSGSGGIHACCVGDTELGIKYRLTPETEDKRAWMVSLYPMLELPTGSAVRDLGAGAHSVFLPVWAQTTRGRWTVFGGGGYWRNSAPDAKNAWAGGVTMLYHASDKLQFGGEFFGTTPVSVDGRASTLFNVGGVYAATASLSLLFSAGHGLRNAAATNAGSAYLGLRMAY